MIPPAGSHRGSWSGPGMAAVYTTRTDSIDHLHTKKIGRGSISICPFSLAGAGSLYLVLGYTQDGNRNTPKDI